jgi:hypothetical protein
VSDQPTEEQLDDLIKAADTPESRERWNELLRRRRDELDEMLRAADCMRNIRELKIGLHYRKNDAGEIEFHGVQGFGADVIRGVPSTDPCQAIENAVGWIALRPRGRGDGDGTA